MKKKRNLIIAIVALIILFTGCSTSVALNTLVPAKANISGYKNIAICSTENASNWDYPLFRDYYLLFRGPVDPLYQDSFKIHSGLDFNTMPRILKNATDYVSNSLNSGFYNIVDAKTTDALVTVGKNLGTTVRKVLNDNGIDAILTTNISGMSYDEYLVCQTDNYKTVDDKGQEYYKKRFYIVQNYSVALTYNLIDVENNLVITYNTISRSSEDSTLVGYTKNALGELEQVNSYNAERASDLISALISDICKEIKLELVPHYRTEYFSLMANKPKLKSLEVAYKLVDSGSYRAALEIFLDEYNKSGHIASGYNASILHYALAEYDEAFEMASQLYFKNGSAKALELYTKMKNVKDRHDEALKQINSTEKSATMQYQELIGF